jgi:ArsR family transcriptional regulator
LFEKLIRCLSKQLNALNTLFKALNDPTRRAILELLRDRPLTAGEIADQFSFSKPTISHHLDLLRQADLVSSDKQGQFVTYTLNMTVMDELLGWLLQFRPSPDSTL